jgi:Dihydrodipicolinate synthase/N-acetylneuraminate lyase
MFRGTFTALVTPFRDGGIDVSAFEQLIETQIAAGITGIVAIGTTGESPTLSHEEREQVIPVAVAKANKRCLVLAGTGSNSTQHAIADTKLAEKLGVDAALLVAPYYNKPSQEGLFRHFKAIADATSLPIMLYNIPGRCGVDICRRPWLVWPKNAATSCRSKKQAVAWSALVSCAGICPMHLRF